jgi:hypothetical protein
VNGSPPYNNPNFGTAHPPMGRVKLKFNGTPIPGASCPLTRRPMAALPTVQAPGQAPFVSYCDLPPFTLRLASPGGLPPLLELEYDGESVTPAAHSPSSSQILVRFNSP